MKAWNVNLAFCFCVQVFYKNNCFCVWLISGRFPAQCMVPLPGKCKSYPRCINHHVTRKGFLSQNCCNTIEFRFNICHDITFSTATMTEHKSNIKLSKNTPYLAIMGELWGVFCEYFGVNWPQYSGTALCILLESILMGYCKKDITPLLTHWSYVKNHFTSIRIPMLKIRQSCDCLIFNMGIPIPGKDSLYIETGPCFFSAGAAFPVPAEVTGNVELAQLCQKPSVLAQRLLAAVAGQNQQQTESMWAGDFLYLALIHDIKIGQWFWCLFHNVDDDDDTI